MLRVCVPRFVTMWVLRVNMVMMREDFVRAKSWGWWWVLLVDMFCRLWMNFIISLVGGSVVVGGYNRWCGCGGNGEVWGLYHNMCCVNRCPLVSLSAQVAKCFVG